ncbi:amidohydrolase family protein, partial [Arthrobacter sp. HMWF013]|uniref:amidohydrolase family protein n=1 Tax=Arthrobacter sp. HMWF013 TaxID=2056849 RepID=UPI001C6299ED
PVLPQWSAEAHLEMMNRLDIATSMLSITSPGVLFGENPVEWARRVNEYGAELVQKHPGRFGLLATLPLPDVDAALAELAHALDNLHADGIVMETNFDGHYLSDPLFEPVLAELDRRRATLFIHPTSPACFEHTSLGYPRPVLEFLLDTTRTIADLVLGGTLDRYPNIQIIVPHCGAALPSVADRLAGFSALFPLGGQNPGDIDVIGTLRRLHYEVGAGYPFPRQLSGLLDLVEPSQLLFGTDYPFGGLAGIERNISALEETSLLKKDDVRNAFRTNALSLFPNLSSR